MRDLDSSDFPHLVDSTFTVPFAAPSKFPYTPTTIATSGMDCRGLPQMQLRFGFFFALVLSMAASPSVGQTFVFHLRGDQEVPPVPSAASGGCMGQLDQGAGEFAL
ncbi:MAG TPA: hypothetical protein VE078_01670, partial [Thermoanaerobaculia bacterium]|nr:hypothetical protein [Thermoanaerobaculia bacterium]